LFVEAGSSKLARGTIRLKALPDGNPLEMPFATTAAMWARQRRFCATTDRKAKALIRGPYRANHSPFQLYEDRLTNFHLPLLALEAAQSPRSLTVTS
jgi:hypothetical protein